MKVEFFKHNISQKEISLVTKTLKSTFLSTGPQTSEFEKKFSKFLNVKNTIGVSSWTMGSLISLKCLGIKEKDEIITTPLTFVATSNTIIQSGAKPIFVDVEAKTGNINAKLIESKITKKTKAIFIVHLYGQMCDIKKIRKIADKYGLYLIEDCAHCIEGERDKIKPGQISDLAIFSFYATKNITSGEGGAIVCRNDSLAKKIRIFRYHGIQRYSSNKNDFQHWDLEEIGFKCNMNDIQASMLIPQIDSINKNLKRREKVFSNYAKGLKNITGVKFFERLPTTKHARHIFTITVDKEIRDRLVKFMQSNGIGVTINYRIVTDLNYYKKRFKSSDFPIAKKIGDSTLTLPFYPSLKNKEQNYVIETLKKGIKNFSC
ncbi:MAG: hypothetical protein CBB97_13835 [Candidatus Endolissoclinum sp. TMED37]|nr:MAG: hypothetical protein CBB97_13835 [Candidatus Endolissoclinum sp. TMED37]|tara:strand:- start:1168 stop:2292 length:1125 start_codon:yes stop_codon:yes gene_type:complete